METVKELTIKRVQVFHRCVLNNQLPCWDYVYMRISLKFAYQAEASVRDSHGLYIGWIRYSKWPIFHVFFFP